MLFKITPNFKCTNLLLCHSFDECILHFRITVLFSVLVIYVGRDSADGILTRYELDGPGIEFRWGARFSAPVQSGPGAHPAYYTMGTGSFPGVKSGRSVTLTTHLYLKLRSMEKCSTSTPHLGLSGLPQEECARLRESVPYVKVYRYKPKYIYPKLNGYGDNGQRSLKL